MRRARRGRVPHPPGVTTPVKETPLIRERLIEEMQSRSRPICVACLSGAVSAEFLAVFAASQDARCASVFERRHGLCPECRCQQQLLFHPVHTR